MNSVSLLISAALLTSAASFGQTTTQPVRVQLTPLYGLSETSATIGSTFGVVIYAASPTQYVNLYGYQFNLKFDPNKVQAVDVKEGADFQNTRASDFIPGIIDNPGGIVRTTFNSLQGKTAAVVVSGSRALAVIQFKALQAGDAEIVVEYPVLVDQAGARVPLTIEPFTAKVR